MRLIKLKLSGFKSFVDPTTVVFPSALVGVVGPNGCGKSNIIDAVRWVMGESSAKHLRGESMTDVIFNGSDDRKPVGQASVELIFDNNQGRLVGEYAAYSEISIKRLVTREGTSNYYLNGTKCRRKDVVDIFLGTGLGPRSYSIISQGTISRLVEAKPEELRVYLEEAAGISKYKERRRETANKIQNTRENIERIDDICHELGKQIDRLSRQAKAAQKYKELKQQEKKLKIELHGIRLKNNQQKLVNIEKKLAEKSLEFSEEKTKQTNLESKQLIQKEKVSVSHQQLDTLQSHYYKTSAQISTLEQTVSHLTQRQSQLKTDEIETQSVFMRSNENLQNLYESIETLKEKLTYLEPELEEQLSKKQNLESELQKLAEKERAWQTHWDEFNQKASHTSNIAHREQANIQQLETVYKEASLTIEKLKSEYQTLDLKVYQQDLDKLAEKKDSLDEKLTQIDKEIGQLTEQINQQKQQSNHIDKNLETKKSRHHQLKAKLTSLETLQEAALGKQNKSLNSWLEENSLNQLPRVVEKIKVQQGYEQAVEVALKEVLQALCMTKNWHLAEQSPPCGEIGFIWDDELASNEKAVAIATSLSDKIETELVFIQKIAEHIFVTDSLEQAKKLLPKLKTHQSIITKNGVLLGAGFLKLTSENSPEDSLIARERAINQVRHDIKLHQQELSTLEAEKENLNQRLETLLKRKETQNKNKVALGVEQTELKGKQRLLQERLSQLSKRQQEIENNLELQTEKLEQNNEALIKARDAWQQAMQKMQQDVKQREQLQIERDNIYQKNREKRLNFDSFQTTLNETELAYKSKQSELSLLKQQYQQESHRCEGFKVKLEQLKVESEKVGDEIIKEHKQKLEQLLADYQSIEQKVAQLKSQHEDEKAVLSTLEKEEKQTLETLSKLQGEQEAFRLEKQSLMVRIQTIEEALNPMGEQALPLIENLPQDANEAVWEEALSNTTLKISRLGAINLAAIEEFEEESKRKQYLDTQRQDLTTALDALEDAIAKIDKETKNRFKETYDLVNTEFQRLFPRLFGGGKAELSLNSDDLLETGVLIMARPPGKRNSTIHLLSGGEKAMTAVALVLSIFQLNPSPFCMLDEVDAPLDDSNVGRFCAIVKEMSKHVQFIFITHNKVTMELATHLSGVTMHEPGVSRIVSVDVDEALALTA